MIFLLSLVAAFMLMVGAARAQDSAEAHKVKAGNYVLEETSHTQFCSKRLRVNVKGNLVLLGTEWSFTWKAHDRQVDPRRSDSKCTIAYRQEIIPGEAKLVRDSTEVCTEGDASPSVRESLSVRGDVLELNTQALTKPAAEWIVDPAKEPLRCIWRRK